MAVLAVVEDHQLVSVVASFTEDRVAASAEPPRVEELLRALVLPQRDHLGDVERNTWLVRLHRHVTTNLINPSTN